MLKCPECGKQTEESALGGYRKCVNYNCKYINDRVLFNGKDCRL